METTATFLRAKVEHFSFVTGLLHGGPIDVNVILGVTIYNDPDYYTMNSDLFQCNDLISFTEGKQVLDHVVTEREASTGNMAIVQFPTIPEEFETETWELDCNDDHKWQLKKKTKYSGVKWLSKEHTNPWDSLCWAVIRFTCDNVQEESIENGEIVHVEEKPYRFRLRKVLQKMLPQPKHLSEYCGA
jgi:hypothetical protein